MPLDESVPKSEEILRLLWSEVERCLRAEAYLAATIMMGSLLEGVLFFLLQENSEAARQCSCAPKNKKDGKVKDFAEWKLGEMIAAAREMEWIGHGITTLSKSVRDFRNSVHPAKQLKNSESPGRSVAIISWQIVQTAIRDEIGKVDSIAKGCEFQVIAKLADEFATASDGGMSSTVHSSDEECPKLTKIDIKVLEAIITISRDGTSAALPVMIAEGMNYSAEMFKMSSKVRTDINNATWFLEYHGLIEEKGKYEGTPAYKPTPKGKKCYIKYRT